MSHTQDSLKDHEPTTIAEINTDRVEGLGPRVKEGCSLSHLQVGSY